jgi:hypothetical protein
MVSLIMVLNLPIPSVATLRARLAFVMGRAAARGVGAA